MLGPLFASFVGFTVFSFFILKPLADYFIDRKQLRKFPSITPLAGISNLWYMWKTTGGQRSLALLEAHKTSPIIRVGPNHLSFSHLGAIKDIYGHGTKITKDNFYQVLAGSHRHVADVQDKAEHSRKRRVLAQAYALKGIANWEFKVVDKVERLVKQFDKRCTAPLKAGELPAPEDLNVNYRWWTNLFTYDAIADIGLSEKLGFLDAGDDLLDAETMDGKIYKTHLRASLHGGIINQAKFVWATEWYPLLAKITHHVGFPSWLENWRHHNHWNDIVYHRTTKRLARAMAGEPLDDFFSSLWEAKDGSPNNLEFGELAAEISIMLNAGSDTTAIATTNALWHLLKSPAHLAKLRAELATVMDESDTVAPYDKVKHLPFLRACIDESMRLHPPTTFGLPRVTPPEGAPVLDHFIPGNTTVSISAYIAHRDPTAFPDPEEYKPERWLAPGAKDLQQYFIAFSAGARGCIGRNISYLEQHILLATVAWRYEFALPSPDFEITRTEGMNMWPGDMPMKIWRRDVTKVEA
ncbi:cytochrome P450 monooxygenase [Geopyxis carbonaria]|nr:cytochrome P450 monooxygenase [Geopyxis carbonaria]